MSGLAGFLPWALLIIGLLAVAILVYLLVMVLKARREAAAATEPAPPEPEPEETSAAEAASSGLLLRDSFRRGLKRLKGLVAARDYRYEIPWFLRLGQAGSRPQEMMAEAGLTLPIGRPGEDGQSELGCTWWFFDRGVVLDLAGEYVLRPDGKSADDRGWSTFLRLLQGARPRRPIDGVILTISCRDLYRVNRDSPQEVAELESKATALYGRIWQAQKTLGLRFPVYVLVTGCEAMEGFDSFAAEVPLALRRGMLGWSCPHALDTAFRPEWSDQAFDAVKHRLDLAQLEIFASGGTRQPDEVFVFPGELDTLRGPMKVFLSRLFQPSAYHESILFRGVYFCGQEGLAAGQPEPVTDGDEPLVTEGWEEGPRRTWFLRDLLERKVFPEARLAAPTASVFNSRNLRVRMAQLLVVGAALFLLAGTWLSTSKLRSREQTLRAFLAETANGLEEIRDRPTVRGKPQIGSTRLEQWAFSLVDDLTTIDARPFRSVFLPSSWFGDFNHRLGEAFVGAYSGVIFQALRLELDRRASELTTPGRVFSARGPETGISAAEAEDAVPIAAVAEFQALEDYAFQLTELASIAQTFNGLNRTRDLGQLSEVYQYLFGRRLPEQFFRQADLYSQALGAVSYEELEPSKFRDSAERKARDLSLRMDRALFRDGVLIRTLTQLEVELGRLGIQASPGGLEAEIFRNIVELTNRVELLLSQPSLSWAFGKRFNLGREYSEAMTLLASSPFFEESGGRGESQAARLAADLRRATEAGWLAHQQKIAGLASRITGPLLEQRDGVPLMQISPDLLLVKAALGDFLNQDFMGFDGTARLRTRVPEGERLRWETSLLSQAADLYPPYQRFRDEGLSRFPTRFRTTLDSVARQRVAAGIVDLVTRAERTAPVSRDASSLVREAEVGEEIERFGNAAEPLERILAIFERLELWDLHRDLSDVIVDQGLELLGEVDDLLKSEGLYLPKGDSFDWWDGSAPVGLAAYDARDVPALGEYVELQNQRMSRLARSYAQPLVQTLEELGALRRLGSRPLVARWDAIVRELQDYDEKKPGNSLAELEGLLLGNLATVRLDNCFASVDPAAAVGGGSDFFLDRRDRLLRGVYDRCRKLAGDRAAASYVELAAFFNQRLAGRYPFADGIDDNFPVEADPETLRDFFRRYDERAPQIRVAPADSPAFLGRGEKILGFIDELDGVRRFLSGFLDAEQPIPAPFYNFEVEFRVNRDNELDGDQILRWAFEVGEQRIVHPPTEPQLIWTFDTPISLSLRWAEGSPWTPAARFEREEIEVSDRTATFTWANRWSLVRLVRDHQALADDFRRVADPRPHTLKFLVPTRREVAQEAEEGRRRGRGKGRRRGEPEVVAPEDLSEARVFVRVSLLEPETEAPILVPSFPRQAPALADRAAASAAGGAR